MKAKLDDGSIVEFPITPALKRESIESAIVHKQTGLIIVYEESSQLGAVFTPGNERWECWTPISREEFIDAIHSIANVFITDHLTKH